MDSVPSSFVSSIKATYEKGGAIPKSLTSGTISPGSPSSRLSKQDGNVSWLSGEYAPNTSGSNMQHVEANGSYYAPAYNRQSGIAQPPTSSSATRATGDRITRFASRSNYSGVETPRSLLDKRSAASRSSNSTTYASSTLPLTRHTTPSVDSGPSSRMSAMDIQSSTLRTPSRASAALDTPATATLSDEQPQVVKTASCGDTAKKEYLHTSLHTDLVNQSLAAPLNGSLQAQASEVAVVDTPELVSKKHVVHVNQQRPNMATHQLPPSAVLATSSSLPNTPERAAAPQNKMLVREVAPVRTRAFQFSYAPHSTSLEFVAIDRTTPSRERSVDVPLEPPASPLAATPDSVGKLRGGGDVADGDDTLSTSSVHSDAQPDSREQSLRHRGNLTSRLFASLRLSKKSRKAKPHAERTLEISSPLSDTLVSSRGGALTSHVARPYSDPSANSSVKPVPAAVLVQTQVSEPLAERGVRPTKLELNAPVASIAPPMVVTPPVHEPIVLLRENAHERNELERFSTPVSSGSDASPQLQVERRERAYVSTALSAFGYTSLRRTPLHSDSHSLSQTDSPDQPPAEFQPPQVDEKPAANSDRPDAQPTTDSGYAETADSGLSASTPELAAEAEAPNTITDQFPLDPTEQREQHAAGDVN